MQRSRRDRLSWIRQARGTLVLAGAVLLALAAASAEGQAVSAGAEVTYAKPQVLLRNQLRRPAALAPRSAGIAAGVDESRREYWVFNGTEGSLDRYFFNKPHPPGDNDHGDGLTYRYATGELERRTGVPAHLVLDRETRNLYVADTAHGRVVRFATPDSTDGARMIATGGPKEGPLYLLPETSVETVVPAGAGLQAPSGLALHDGTLWVGDYATGRIHLFGLDGTPVRVIETGLGANSLTGIALGWGDSIYALDARRHRLVRLRASG